MATLPGFNFFTSNVEQTLHENLIVESIRMYAHNMYYLPRTITGSDDIMNEVEAAEFNTALPIELYIKNIDAFEGDGQFLSKFGLEVRDQMTMNLSKRSFETFVKPTTTRNRPFEGDIIFIPMLGVAYQIKYVKSDSIFYAFGKLNMFEVVCDLYENTGDTFNTGNTIIDNTYPPRGNISDIGYDVTDDDSVADNAGFQTEANSYLDLSEDDPFTEGSI